VASKFWKLGVIGWPLGYSLSPLMHNAALRAAGLQGEYEQCPIKSNELGESLHEFAQLDDLQPGIEDWQTKGKLLDGFNITRPFKSKAYVWIQKKGGKIKGALGSVAHAMHVINTVKIDQGELSGYNTDGEGFVHPLKGIDLKGASAIILGAGGAARSIGISLGVNAQVGRIAFWNRTLENGQRTVNVLNSAFQFNDRNVELEICSDLRVLPVEECKILVNATPMGQRDEDKIPEELFERLRPSHLVYDIVYEPRETKLIQEARKRGCRVITGDEMLAAQGAEAFEIWTGEPAAKVLPVMRNALDEYFKTRG